MPYYCAERIARALNGAASRCRAAAVLLLGVSYKGDVGRRARVARAAADRAAARGGRRTSPTTTRTCPAAARAASAWTRVELDRRRAGAADIVCVVTAHCGVDYARVAERAQLVIDFRNVGARPAPTERWSGCERAGADRHGRAWAAGARTCCATSARCPRPTCAGPATPTPAHARRLRRRSTRDVRSPPTTGELLDDPELDAVVLATPVPTHFELARAAIDGRQARDGREADDVARGRGPRAARRWCTARGSVLMVGHLLRFHPGVEKLRAADRLGRAGRGPLRLRQPGQPGRDPRGRERAVEPGRARHLGGAAPDRRPPGRGLGARRGLPAAGRRGRRVRLRQVRHRARSATCTCRGSTRTRCAR